MNKIPELDFLQDIPSAVTTATNYNNNYNKQIERTALQIREGEQLLDIEKAWLIPAGISKQAFSKNPFLLTTGELNIDLRKEVKTMVTRKLEYNNTFTNATCAICGAEYQSLALEWRLRYNGCEGFNLICYKCGKADKETLHTRLQEHIESIKDIEFIDQLEAFHECIDEMETDTSVVDEVLAKEPTDGIEKEYFEIAKEISDFKG